MDPAFIGMLVVLCLVLYALLVNGWTDAPNAIVTVVSTGVLPLRTAIAIAVVANVLGGLYGTKVALTISKGIVEASALNLPAVGAAMASIIAWGSFAGFVGLPISKSHSLVAGLAGAALACAGPSALIASGWMLILIGILFSSLITFILAWHVAHIVRYVAILASRFGIRPQKMRKAFDRLQMVSATAMGWVHGINDTQKFAGAFVLVLVLANQWDKTAGIPWWVTPLCAATMGVGTMIGGWKIIRTVGLRMTQMTSTQGFSAETTASTVLFGLANFGVPTSTTHTINCAIVGTMASEGARHVRWDVLGKIVLAWICTFPICAGIAFAAAYVANQIF